MSTVIGFVGGMGAGVLVYLWGYHNGTRRQLTRKDQNHGQH